MKLTNKKLRFILSFITITSIPFIFFNSNISVKENKIKVFNSNLNIKRNIIQYTEPIEVKTQDLNGDTIDLKKVLTNLSIVVKGNNENIENNKKEVFEYLKNSLKGNFKIYKSKYTDFIFVDFLNVSSEDYFYNQNVVNFNKNIKNAFLTKKNNFETLKTINAYGSSINISNVARESINQDKLNYIGLSNYTRNQEIEKNARKILANRDNRIKIGVLDDGKIKRTDDFNDKTVKITNQERFWWFNNNYSDHATQVASIIAGKGGINPFAHLYGIRVFTYNGISQEIEWLIEQGVKIINISMKIDNNSEYNVIANYLDKIQNDSSVDVTIVNAAGNDGELSDHKLKSNALSFNSISVGALKRNSSSIANYSSYARENYSDKRPTLTAPGSFVFSQNEEYGKTFFNKSGTSFSAPVVTGILSLAMQNKPEVFLKGKDNLISLSALSTSADTYNSNEKSNTHGAGILNYNNLLDALENVEYIRLYGNEDRAINKRDIDVKNVYMRKGQTIKSALVWNFKNKFEEQTNDPSWDYYTGYTESTNSDLITKPVVNDFDFRIRDSSGNSLKSSTSAKDNVEIISYTAEKDGYYKLEINQFKQVKRNESFDLVVSYLIK